MLTVITPTGDRPEAFELCCYYMGRQDYSGSVRWVVVDDGVTPTKVPSILNHWDVQVIRPKPIEGNSQARNLLMGMAFVSYAGKTVIVEDDDAYSPGYLTFVEAGLAQVDLFGERNTRYYNVSTGCGQVMRNDAHASLCATALKGDATELLVDILTETSVNIDVELWRKFKGLKGLSDTNYVTGIKGLPGRKGLGVGHRSTFGTPMDLRDWIGDDARLYGR